jgi:Holliday junction DNA helicase RuvA
MITGIRGRVTRREPGGIEVALGPVRVFISVPAYISESATVGKIISLETVLLSDETGIHLYGFRDGRERDFFLRLLQVNSVGKKAALKAMEGGLERAIARIKKAWLTDEGVLDGLGPKTSRKVIAELGEEVASGVWGKVDDGGVSAQEEALQALKALGVKEREARAALLKVLRRGNKEMSAEKWVKEALKELR